MNISEASQTSGLSADTIRFYERRGVISAPGRSANGYRNYTDRHVATLRFARGLKELGLPLTDIASMVQLAHDGMCGELRGAMVSLMDQAVRRLDDRRKVLRSTSRELNALRNGLFDMHPKRANIPGVTPCECVELVGSPRNYRSARRADSRPSARL